MNKGELVALMAEEVGHSKTDAEKALTWVVGSVLKALSRGEDVNLVGFGSFHIQSRAAREGRNPKTGEKMHIAAYKQPVFRAGKKMKEACNNS
ncbi:HU family DNA-binding protein [Rickettsia endosymbiont of Culicoides newsteadi]|uniref:HU family DNA-binding protein n=1 Tax=Rickettsia endosymbiont of Culicoides newsteadi TaxID=1961830 RepID=UPI000B9BBB12|nr:HU family DNA-binding protein [Rickettsia endosymbiont of Culicoides newsteadi]OZG31682.1 DNA-binding protein [Rickettsia endosymbiont of Culicoides newsteadi]